MVPEICCTTDGQAEKVTYGGGCQCTTLMCTESETMCYPNGHFLIHSHCAQWRKKLHMCRKIHNVDRRKKKVKKKKENTPKIAAIDTL